LYLFRITTIFQTNILFKTNKCHHGGPLGAEGPGQLPPVSPLNPALQPGPALAGAGPKARPKRGAPLSSGFMTSSCLLSQPSYHLFDEDILAGVANVWRMRQIWRIGWFEVAHCIPIIVIKEDIRPFQCFY